MNLKKTLYWTPRILTILFTALISIFALDVFVEYSFPEVLVALFMHLIPTFILILLLAISWKKELYGGIGFLVLALVPLFFFNEPLESFFILSLPLIAVGILFMVSWKINKKK